MQSGSQTPHETHFVVPRSANTERFKTIAHSTHSQVKRFAHDVINTGGKYRRIKVEAFLSQDVNPSCSMGVNTMCDAQDQWVCGGQSRGHWDPESLLANIHLLLSSVSSLTLNSAQQMMKEVKGKDDTPAWSHQMSCEPSTSWYLLTYSGGRGTAEVSKRTRTNQRWTEGTNIRRFPWQRTLTTWLLL